MSTAPTSAHCVECDGVTHLQRCQRTVRTVQEYCHPYKYIYVWAEIMNPLDLLLGCH